MESTLRRLAELNPLDSTKAAEESVRLFAALVDTVRPKRKGDADTACTALRALAFLISQNDELRVGLQRAMHALFAQRPALRLLTGAGILPSTGFFTEATRRIGHTLLPEVLDTRHLRGVLRLLFPHRSDTLWVSQLPDAVWIELLQALYPPSCPERPKSGGAEAELLESMRTLSYWIAASGLEPELVRLEPDLSRYESPFVALNIETMDFIAACSEAKAPDGSHLTVLLGQCHQWLDRIRRQAMRFGTSIALTFRVRRLRQLLKRLERLLDAYTALQTPCAAGRDWKPLVILFKRLVKAECQSNDLTVYWRQHMSLLALRITENASRTGEHYITSDRGDYFALLRSALGAGIIIAFMALFKTLLTKLELAPLNESLVICLNYGLGFVVIHLLHKDRKFNHHPRSILASAAHRQP